MEKLPEAELMPTAPNKEDVPVEEDNELSTLRSLAKSLQTHNEELRRQLEEENRRWRDHINVLNHEWREAMTMESQRWRTFCVAHVGEKRTREIEESGMNKRRQSEIAQSLDLLSTEVDGSNASPAPSQAPVSAVSMDVVDQMGFNPSAPLPSVSIATLPPPVSADALVNVDILWVNGDVQYRLKCEPKSFDVGWATKKVVFRGSKKDNSKSLHVKLACLGSLECPKCQWTQRPFVRKDVKHKGRRDFCQGICFSSDPQKQVELEFRECNCIFEWRRPPGGDVLLFRHFGQHNHRQPPLAPRVVERRLG